MKLSYLFGEILILINISVSMAWIDMGLIDFTLTLNTIHSTSQKFFRVSQEYIPFFHINIK